MNKPQLSQIFLLPVISLIVIWSLFFVSTMAPKAAPAEQAVVHTPEHILGHVKSLQQNVFVLNFWASWCEPCKEELPALKSLEEKFLASGLKVILISIDETGEIPEAESFLRDNNIGLKSFYRGDQSLNFVSQIYPKWTGAVPATVIMDRNLKVLDAWEGDTSLEEFEERVAPFLRGKS